MASIATRLFNYQPANYLLLGGEEWVRPLPQLGAWNRLRIGILAAVRPVSTGTSLFDGGLFFGLCSGRTNTASALNPDNNVGVCICGNPVLNATTRSWAYNANSGYPYYSVSTNGSYYHRYTNPISNQVTVASGLNASPWLPVAGIGIRKRRVPMVLDISRNPTTSLHTVTIYWPTDQTADWRADQLLEAVDSYGQPNIGGNAWTNATAGTFNAAENTGMLDTVTVWWTNVTYPLELYAVCAALLADPGTSNQVAYPMIGGGYDVFGTTGTLVGGVISGTGVVATGLTSGRGFYAPYTLGGTASVAPQVSLSGSDMGSDETFDQYANGTVITSTLNSGTNWSGPWVLAGTYSNVAPIIMTAGTGTLYGTLVGGDDSFDQYASGTAISGLLNKGTWWGGAWQMAGTYPNIAPLLGGTGTLYGTQINSSDSFETYSLGTFVTLTQGSNWAGPGGVTYYSGTTYPNFGAQNFMAGTSAGFPWDNFEGYPVGAITILNRGTGWSSYGTIT